MEWVRGARKRDGKKPPPAPSSQPFEEVEERTAGCPGGVVGAVDGGLEVLRGGEAEGGPGAAAAPRPAAAPGLRPAAGCRPAPAAAAVAASCALEETVGRRRDAGGGDSPREGRDFICCSMEAKHGNVRSKVLSHVKEFREIPA